MDTPPAGTSPSWSTPSAPIWHRPIARSACDTLEVFRTSFRFEDGLLHPSDTPGLGVELDTEAAGRFPYQPAYLPVNRLADGTVHDW